MLYSYRVFLYLSIRRLTDINYSFLNVLIVLIICSVVSLIFFIAQFLCIASSIDIGEGVTEKIEANPRLLRLSTFSIDPPRAITGTLFLLAASRMQRALHPNLQQLLHQLQCSNQYSFLFLSACESSPSLHPTLSSFAL